MKAGWERKRVADIAQHSLGKMLDKAKNKGEPRPYLRNLNVRWFDFDVSDVLEMRFLPSEVERYSVRKGDVLVCEGGYPGRAAIWDRDEPIFFQKALHRVRFHDPKVAKWFVYYLQSKDLDGTLSEHFNGAGIQHLTGEALARFEVPLPPADERERIVNALDEVFEGIATARANAERNLRNARALFERRLEHVFSCGQGWLRRRLGDLAVIQYGYTESATAQPVGPKFLRITDIRENAVGWASVPFCPIPADERPKYLLGDGDIVFARTGATTGKSFLVSEPPEAIFASYLIRVRLHAGAPLPAFVNLFFQTGKYWDAIRTGTTGSAQGGFNASKLADLVIPFPASTDEQGAIVRDLAALSDKLSQLADVYARKLASLDELKRSLLHHAFTGQLTDRTTAALGA